MDNVFTIRTGLKVLLIVKRHDGGLKVELRTTRAPTEAEVTEAWEIADIILKAGGWYSDDPTPTGFRFVHGGELSN